MKMVIKDEAMHALGQVTTFDTEPVVRCRDCLYRNYDNCPFNEFSEMYRPEDDFYCAAGERKV